MVYTRYPFDYFLIYLLSIFHENKHILREVGKRFQHVIEPVFEIDNAMLFGATWERLKERRVASLRKHIDGLREKYPVIIRRDDTAFEQIGVLSAYQQSSSIVDAYKILTGPERRTLELSILCGVLPADIRRVVHLKHGIDINEAAIQEFSHYFFNIPLLLREDALRYFDLLPAAEGRAYKDVYTTGKAAYCVHMDINSDEFNPKEDQRLVYKMAYTQLMRFKDMPSDAGRVAMYWMRIMNESHDRLKDGDDFVKRMLRIMTLFSLGEEKQAFAELDAATGEILH